MGRMGAIGELDGVVILLCSGASTYITGADFVVDGQYCCVRVRSAHEEADSDVICRWGNSLLIVKLSVGSGEIDVTPLKPP